MITPSITETQIFTALRAFMLLVADCEVIRTPVNRAAMPKGDVIALSPTSNTPLSTNVATVDGQQQSIKRASQFVVQVDCYGAGAGDRATTLSTLLRSQFACEQLAASGLEIQPLYAGDAHQMPLVNGEDQYEERWTFDAVLQFNPVLVVVQQSALSLTVIPKDVDRMFPP